MSITTPPENFPRQSSDRGVPTSGPVWPTMRRESPLARWVRRVVVCLLIVVICILTAVALSYCGPGSGGCK
jgi:hypothetical protein